MITYKDRVFCINPTCTCGPDRKLTDEVKAAAEKWWGGPDYPISCGIVCGPRDERFSEDYPKESPDAP